MQQRTSIVVGFLLVVALCGMALSADKQSEKARSREARKELTRISRELRRGKIDRAIDRLRAFEEKFADHPLVEKAKKLRVEYGDGGEVRVVLKDRKVFRKRFQMPEPKVLAMADEALKELRARYAHIEPFFDHHWVKLSFYDSQARYRKVTGSVTTDGQFLIREVDLENSRVGGEIQWHFPQGVGSVKDRTTYLKAILYHECTHYLNTTYFGTVLPMLFEEGLAVFLETRLNTDYYQAFRETVRQIREGEARNGLRTIEKYDDFVSFLSAKRGFRQGGRMIDRWYGYCYAIVDFLDRGNIEGIQVGFRDLTTTLAEMTRAKMGKVARKNPKSFGVRLDNREVLETLVRRFYNTDLKTFHKHLVRHILKNYKQR